MSAWLGRMPWALVGLFLFLVSTVSAEPPEADRFARLVRELDADAYAVRQRAHHELVAGGKDAIDALCVGITSDSPEVAWRSATAVEQIALLGEESILNQTLGALERLNQVNNKPGWQRIVSDLQQRQSNLRHERAAKQIRALGGKFLSDAERSLAANTGASATPSIIISDEVELPLNLPEEIATPPGIGALDVAIRVAIEIAPPTPTVVIPAAELPAPQQVAERLPEVQSPAEPPTPAPPPNLPSDAIAPAAAAPAFGLGQGFIADAFVSPEFIPAPDADVLDDAHSKKSESLIIDQLWRGGDLGLATLRELPNLVSLTLRRAPLTDQSLEQIAALPRLESLDIESASVSATALTKFHEQHPHVRLIARGPAVLGVNAEISGPCILIGVLSGSGAAEAGLQVGDEVVAVASQKVNNFSDLTIAVYSRQPGEKLLVEYHRGGQRRTAEVQLKERKYLETVKPVAPR